MNSWHLLSTIVAASVLFQNGDCQQCPEKEILETKIQNAKDELKVLEFALSQCTVGLNASNPGESCEDIFCRHNSFEDGEFWIKNKEGESVLAYCAYEPIPNRNKKAMRRIGYLDMTDSDQHCPSGSFREVTRSEKRVCARDMRTGGCASVSYSSNNTPYKTICGRVKAYQYSSPSAFFNKYAANPFSIDGPYVEGVSITRGSPRKHVWSFANALGENLPRTHSDRRCPCMDPTGAQRKFIPRFVGRDYFCDTGSHIYPTLGVFFPDDPLWDGEGCEAPSNCCIFNNPPWFCKELAEETTDNVELRLCGDEDAFVNEDSPIEQIEIYVK